MTFVDQAYAVIKARILGNRYPPGFQALEKELAVALGMSRTPLREALIRLQQEGLVELVPRRGVRVVPIAPEDMREIYEVLTSLEVTAAELAARRQPDEGRLAPLEEALGAMEAALGRDDLEAWAAADAAFHRALVALAGNRRLAEMAATLADQVHRARMATLRLRPKPIRSVAEHREVLEAIRRGDAGAAASRHRQHRARAAALLMDLLRTYRLAHL